MYLKKSRLRTNGSYNLNWVEYKRTLVSVYNDFKFDENNM